VDRLEIGQKISRGVNEEERYKNVVLSFFAIEHRSEVALNQ
jgi:hypothetical protein